MYIYTSCSDQVAKDGKHADATMFGLYISESVKSILVGFRQKTEWIPKSCCIVARSTWKSIHCDQQSRLVRERTNKCDKAYIPRGGCAPMASSKFILRGDPLLRVLPAGIKADTWHAVNTKKDRILNIEANEWYDLAEHPLVPIPWSNEGDRGKYDYVLITCQVVAAATSAAAGNVSSSAVRYALQSDDDVGR